MRVWSMKIQWLYGGSLILCVSMKVQWLYPPLMLMVSIQVSPGEWNLWLLCCCRYNEWLFCTGSGSGLHSWRLHAGDLCGTRKRTRVSYESHETAAIFDRCSLRSWGEARRRGNKVNKVNGSTPSLFFTLVSSSAIYFIWLRCSWSACIMWVLSS